MSPTPPAARSGAPHRPRQRSLPPGGVIAPWQADDGWTLRTGVWARPGDAGVVLLCGGRGDFIEKYAEVIWDLCDAGFGVVSFDWRGQGLSGRLAADPGRAHMTDLARHVADLAGLFAGVVVPLAGDTPRLLMAHSMGGNIALRFLHSAPDAVARAVLSAPMLGISTAPFPVRLARVLARRAVQLGAGERYAFGQLPYGPAFRSPLRQARLTGDADRFADEGWWVDQQPELAVGGVTNGWVDAAFRSIDTLMAPGVLEAITTPVLLLSAGLEKLVSPAAIAAAAARLPHARLVNVPGGRHELIKEADALRQPLMAQVIAFLRGDLSIAGGPITL